MAMNAPDMSEEINRFGTFLGWPGKDGQCKQMKPYVTDLAKAGFYYTQQGDEVCCFACNLVVGDWERHNDPVVVHATRSPQCPFVMNARGCNNRSVFVPAEREYSAIKLMLREIGKRVASTRSGTTYTSTSLIPNTLRMLYGDSMRCSDPQLSAPHPGSISRSLSSSPRMNRPSGRQVSVEQRPPAATGRGAHSSRAGGHASSTPPPRRSSASDSTDVTASANNNRSRFQRARSCAADPRAARNSETIANRQTSAPGVDQVEYQDSEEARLQTFKGWPGIRGATAREFAQAGFVYIGPPDRVQCVFCSGILRNWNDNDLPIEEHRKHFPQCSFVVEFLSAINVARPRHPKYQTEPSRLSSFREWDMSKNPTPAELAKAGFFYVGHGDSVKCFFCDGGLRNWEPNDDPWREHARWFPKCAYVRQAKGKPFIDAVLSDTNLTEYQTASVDETEVKNVARTAGQRTVEPREVTARMDSAIVKAVLKMDVPKNLVKKAIRRRLAEDGEDFTSAEALLEAVFSLDLGSEGDDEDNTQQEIESKDLLDNSSLSSVGSSNPDSMRLMEENRLLKEQRQCKICMDEEVCVAFLPCGHLVCCSTCAPALNLCPICRAKIRGTVRTYLS